MAKFIILRDANATSRRRAPRDARPDPCLELADLTAGDLRTALRDPMVVRLARVMPTQLIEPEPLDDIRPDEAVPGWGLHAIGASDSPCTGAGVRVALLDTGVDADHPAFAGIALNRQDFVGSGDDDAHGHGTHCAGTIFGRAVDGQRIGVAPGITTALTAKVLRDDGFGFSDMLFQGLLWAAQAGAQVIALSLRFDLSAFSANLLRDEDFPQSLATAVALEGHRANLALFEALLTLLRGTDPAGGGPIVIAAAGNDSRRTVSPNFEVSASAPARAAGVVSVGALTEGEAGLEVAPFSNTLPTCVAPGGGIVSAAIGGGLRALNGTSMACAHVAGATALWWEHQTRAAQSVTADAVIAHLYAAEQSDIDTGHGLVRTPSETG